MEECLYRLSTIDSVSGSEENKIEYLKKELLPYAKIRTDHNGNLIAEMGSGKSGLHILLDAHIDQIGLIVSYIDDGGFLKAEPCGGIDNRVLLGSMVTVLGKRKIAAVVCSMPPHLSSGGEDKAIKTSEIWLDTGLTVEEVESQIELGDRAVVYNSPQKLLNHQFMATGLDNSASVAVLIKCIKTLAKEQLNCKLSFLFSSQEEVGGMGAKTAAFALNPSEAIAIDVSFAKQPGIAPEMCKPMGKGPLIGIAPVLNKEMVSLLKQIAGTHGIPYQLEIMNSTTGTNADHIGASGSGVKTALVSIPMKNMHTQSEIISLKDMQNTAELLCSYILKRSEQAK